MDAAKKFIVITLGAGLLVLFAALLAPSASAAGPQPYPVAKTSPSLGVDATSSSAPRPVASTTGGGTSGQSDSSGGLSDTGVAVFSITALGLALLVGGSVLLFGGRRKHAHR